MRRMLLPAGVAAAAVLTATLSGCGSTPPSPGAALSRYLAAWGKGDWAAMRRQVIRPPASFTPVNAAVFAALGVARASFTAGRVRTAPSGTSASVRVTEHFDLPHAGTW